jgi:hypothetical protein
MSRPRIRTLKPETWQDERVGNLSRDARLLFVGLITMADDEGRLRALPALILGHCFPYDADALRRLEAWMAEIAASGLVERYEVGGTPYAQIIGWAKHQKINRPSPSGIPPAPSTESSVNDHGTDTEGSSLVCGRAGADWIGSDQEGKEPPLPPASGGSETSAFEEKRAGRARTGSRRARDRQALQAVEAARVQPTTPGDREAWQVVVNELAGVLPESTFFAWVEPLRLVGVDAGVLVIEGPVNQRQAVERVSLALGTPARIVPAQEENAA